MNQRPSSRGEHHVEATIGNMVCFSHDIWLGVSKVSSVDISPLYNLDQVSRFAGRIRPSVHALGNGI